MIGHVAEPVAAEVPAPAEASGACGLSRHRQPSRKYRWPRSQLKNSGLNSWFSTPPPNPWEAEAQKANRLASAWDTGLASPTQSDTGARGDVSFESAGAPDEIEVVSGANSEIVAAAAETVRQETSHAGEQVERQAETSTGTAHANGEVHDAAANMDMDAIVAKVFSRLSPGLLTDATRDILKPVVEAVIREELNAKKL